MEHSAQLNNSLNKTIKEMEIGAIGKITQTTNTTTTNLLVLKTFTGFVCLTDPSKTWDFNDTTNKWKVEILPKGTKITLTVGGGF